jgi:hypothetical protein
MTIPDDYAADLEELAPTEDKVAEVVSAALRQIEAEDRVASLQNELKAAQDDLKGIAEGALPAALDAAGMASYRLLNGFEVSVKTTTVGNIAKDDAPIAHASLEAAGHGDMIKRKVDLVFGRGEADVAARVVTFLKGLSWLGNRPVNVHENVHPQTLSAFVREQIAAGAEVPEGITVLSFRAAVVTRPKPKKGAGDF